MTLGPLPDGLPNQHYKGTYKRNSTWLLNERNVYVNGNVCLYWYGRGQQKRWFLNHCGKVGWGSRLSSFLLCLCLYILFHFILRRVGHSSYSINACPHSKSIEWQFWNGDNFVDTPNLRPTCDIGNSIFLRLYEQPKSGPSQFG